MQELNPTSLPLVDGRIDLTSHSLHAYSGTGWPAHGNSVRSELRVGLVVHMLGYFRNQGIGEECTKTQDQTVTAKSLGCHSQNSRFWLMMIDTKEQFLGIHVRIVSWSALVSWCMSCLMVPGEEVTTKRQSPEVAFLRIISVQVVFGSTTQTTVPPAFTYLNNKRLDDMTKIFTDDNRPQRI